MKNPPIGGFFIAAKFSNQEVEGGGVQRSEDQVIAAPAAMKNPPRGGFFIAAKFPNRDVERGWRTKKPRSSNHRASGNEEPAERWGFIAAESLFLA
jgi:hypothetical protein